MRVEITKDMRDGSESKSKPFDLDGMSMSELTFMLMDADVIGLTISKKNPLRKMIRDLKPQEKK